jgi:hypothetical protein
MADGRRWASRLEPGPVLMALGGAVLIVSLSQDWYEGGLTAWAAFEVLDLVLATLGGAIVAAAVGVASPRFGIVEPRVLLALVGAILVIVGVQAVDPPPPATGRALGTGTWMALAGAFTAVVGGLLTFGRISLAVTRAGSSPFRVRS